MKHASETYDVYWEREKWPLFLAWRDHHMACPQRCLSSCGECTRLWESYVSAPAVPAPNCPALALSGDQPHSPSWTHKEKGHECYHCGGYFFDPGCCVDCELVVAKNAIAAAKAEGAKEERERIRALGPFTTGPALSPGDQDRCDLYNLAHEAGRKQGAKEATAAIVKWLWHQNEYELRAAANDIQRGDHLKPEAGK